MITDRVSEIFSVLSNGATGIDDLQRELEKKGIQITTGALRKILYTNRSNGYITSKRYSSSDRTGIFALYALTEAAAEILCQKSNYRIESIRMQLPAPHHVTHEAWVTKVFRSIRSEAKRLGIEVTMAHECYFRIPLTGFPKKMPLPDIFLRYSNDTSEIDTYDVEVDNNTTPARRLFSKVVKLPHKTLLLCPTRSRIQALIASFIQLASFLENSKNKNKIPLGLKEKVFFALLEDFCTPPGGVCGTIWQNMYGNPQKINLGKRTSKM